MQSINKFSISKARRARARSSPHICTCTHVQTHADRHTPSQCGWLTLSDGKPRFKPIVVSPVICSSSAVSAQRQWKKKWKINNPGRLLKLQICSLPSVSSPYLTPHAHTYTLVANYNMVSNDLKIECSSKTLNCNLLCTDSISIWSRMKFSPHVAGWSVSAAVCVNPVEPESTKQRGKLHSALPLGLIPDHQNSFVRMITQKDELICYQVARWQLTPLVFSLFFYLICLCCERFDQISLWQIDHRQCSSLFRANLGDRWPVVSFG